jgi:threonine/homoserine efflux transporter RhtA
MASVPEQLTDHGSSKSFAAFVALDALGFICMVIGGGALFAKSAMPFVASELTAWTMIVVGVLLMTISIRGIVKGIASKRRHSRR